MCSFGGILVAFKSKWKANIDNHHMLMGEITNQKYKKPPPSPFHTHTHKYLMVRSINSVNMKSLE